MKTERIRWKQEWRRLADTDLQSLELDQAGSWPLLLRLTSFVLVLVVTLAGIYGFLVRDRLDALAQATAQQPRLLTAFQDKATQAARLDLIETQIAGLDGQMKQLQARLPTRAEVPRLLDGISDAALDNGLIIEAIRLASPEPKKHFIEQPVEIEVIGGFHQLGRFLADMAALSRIVTQHDFTLEPVDDAGTRLRLSTMARIYRALPADETEGAP